MFNLGAGEILIILVIALLLLGPRRLPEMARGIGKFMHEFRRQTDDIRHTVEREFYKMDQEIAVEDRPLPPPMGARAPAMGSRPPPVGGPAVAINPELRGEPAPALLGEGAPAGLAQVAAPGEAVAVTPEAAAGAAVAAGLVASAQPGPEAGVAGASPEGAPAAEGAADTLPTLTPVAGTVARSRAPKAS